MNPMQERHSHHYFYGQLFLKLMGADMPKNMPQQLLLLNDHKNLHHFYDV